LEKAFALSHAIRHYRLYMAISDNEIAQVRAATDIVAL